MTQLTKREQIALAIFLERYKVDEDQSIPDMIACSIDHADKFLECLSETEPDIQPVTKSVFQDVTDLEKSAAEVAKDLADAKDRYMAEHRKYLKSVARITAACNDIAVYAFSTSCKGTNDLSSKIYSFVKQEIDKAYKSNTNEDEPTN